MLGRSTSCRGATRAAHRAYQHIAGKARCLVRCWRRARPQAVQNKNAASSGRSRCRKGLYATRFTQHVLRNTHPAVASSDSDTQNPVFWERLRSLFTRNEEEKERPEGEKRRRAIAVVVCFLISAVLWFTFTLQDTHTVSMTIPTTVQNSQGAQALTTLPPEAVSAEVEGAGTALLRFYWGEPRVPVGVESEQVNVENRLQAKLPGGARLKSVSPTVMSLRREARQARTVPVRLRGTVGTPATHDLMHPPRIQPDSVRISGARSLVQDIEAWPTERIRIKNLTDSLHRRVALSDTLGGLVTRFTESVALRAQARQFTEGIRSIDVRVTGGPESSVTLDPSSIRVRYRTLVEDFQQAQSTDQFYATVSYGQIRADTSGRVDPRLHTPPGLEIRDVEMYPSALRYYNFVADS